MRRNVSRNREMNLEIALYFVQGFVIFRKNIFALSTYFKRQTVVRQIDCVHDTFEPLVFTPTSTRF